MKHAAPQECLKIAVLCGGVSTEREVSLNSGKAVAKGLNDAGYSTVIKDLHSISELLNSWDEMNADAAFIALHGGWGEDGRLQAALKSRGIKYTGSEAASCRLAMDKDISRFIISNAGIRVPAGTCVLPGDEYIVNDSVVKWGKVVVKPASGGSTVGVCITDSAKEASAALTRIWDIDTKAVIEEFIPGRDLTAAVIGTGDSSSALPPIEIAPKSGFYDYEAKYTPGTTKYTCPAEIGDPLIERLKNAAVRIHLAHGCRAYSRTDFRVTEHGEIFALEINTEPGMTSTSLVPKAAAAQGWSFSELLTKILKESGIT